MKNSALKKPAMEPLLTVHEVAEILGASTNWVYQHLDKAKAKPVIPHFLLGGKVRFRRAELEAFLDECRRDGVLE